jgi:hypothetical protein
MLKDMKYSRDWDERPFHDEIQDFLIGVSEGEFSGRNLSYGEILNTIQYYINRNPEDFIEILRRLLAQRAGIE